MLLAKNKQSLCLGATVGGLRICPPFSARAALTPNDNLWPASYSTSATVLIQSIYGVTVPQNVARC